MAHVSDQDKLILELKKSVKNVAIVNSLTFDYDSEQHPYKTFTAVFMVKMVKKPGAIRKKKLHKQVRTK